MAKVIFSPDARADLQEIWDYISDDSPFQADRFLERIRVKLEHIAKWNTLGRPRPELSKDCRSYPFEKYCFYFRPINGGSRFCMCCIPLATSRKSHSLSSAISRSKAGTVQARRARAPITASGLEVVQHAQLIKSLVMKK